MITFRACLPCSQADSAESCAHHLRKSGLTSRLGAGVPTAGTGFELQAIAACVIGGASLSGARGSAIGAACGALIIGVLNNGGNLLAINAFYLQIAIGGLILVAVGFDQMNTRASARR